MPSMSGSPKSSRMRSNLEHSSALVADAPVATRSASQPSAESARTRLTPMTSSSSTTRMRATTVEG